MALFGAASAFIVAVLADLFGSDRTRGFTRAAFVLFLLQQGGMGPAAWIFAAGGAVTTLL
jgi:hypothetical protein